MTRRSTQPRPSYALDRARLAAYALAQGWPPQWIEWQLAALELVDGLTSDEELRAGVRPFMHPEVPWSRQ